MPEITGETANGRSMSVDQQVLARETRTCAMAHPAATPNTRLHGTAIAAASSVSLSAASASGSRMAAR